MPAYQSSPAGNNPVAMLQLGVTAYAFGSSNVNQPTVKMSISLVSLSTNVATLTIQMLEGFIPSVGQLITVVGTTSASGAFNVTNVALTVVTINSTTGAGTVSFALVHADVVQVADAGAAYVPVPEVGEALANGSSQAFAIQESSGENENGITVTWRTKYPSAPATVTMTLQAAINNADADYVTLDSSTNTSGEIRSITLTRYRFLRVTASSVTGGSNPTSIVSISI